jgi:penicillin amidase
MHSQPTVTSRSVLAIALVLGVVALLGVTAPAVPAKTLKAEDVLPPGQSGFVSIAGVPTGTGSPHLTDQIDLFNHFQYKSQQFDQPGDSETPMAGVQIVRDAYGVPAITGDTEYDGWWGVGYAVAQDRLFQLDIFRRATNGTLAEILGSSYLEMDYVDRRDYYTDAEIDDMLAKLPARFIHRIEAYRDGVNAWIDHANTTPTDMPGEFPALADLPIAPWTVEDTARVGVYLARTVPSGDGLELDNARGLAGVGKRDFQKVIPLRGKGRRTTIPRSEGVFPSQPGRTRQDERIGLRRSTRFMKRSHYLSAAHDAEDSQPFSTATTASASAPAGSAPPLARQLQGPGGSFMWAIRDRARHRAYLYNGPQLGFSIPELFVEFELHSPQEPDLRGVTAAGVPVVGIGHNDHVAWGFTSGLSDDNDLYVDKLTGPESYRFRGHSRQMDCRDETFDWQPPATSLPDLVTDPGQPAGSKTVRICRTIHGPVQGQADGYAFARRYATWGRELETLIGLDEVGHARDVHDVDHALRHDVTWNENVIAADDRGNIGYWHPGLHPLRPRRWDERLPYPGTGKAEWRGLLPRRRTPHVINPSQGWLTQWNNFPSVGWTSGDAPARERLDGRFHRVHLLQRLVSRVARDPSYKASRAIVKRSGTTSQGYPFLDVGKVKRAMGLSRSDQAIATLKALLEWDGSYTRVDQSGTVDPGVAIWEQFKRRLQGIEFRDLGPGARHLSEGTSLSHQFDTTNIESLALRTLGAKAYARAAKATAAQLGERFGTPKVESWRAPRRMYHVSAQGAGSSPDLPFFDRGTWNQSVSLGH